MTNLTKYKIDANSQAPKYIQLKRILKDMASEMKPHDMLPSENKLAEEFNLHRLTSRQAITELVNEGTLYRKRGKGTFISVPIDCNSKTTSKNIACYFRRLRTRREDDNFFLEIFEGFEDEITKNNSFMIYRSFTRSSVQNKETVLQNARELLAANVSALVFDERVSDDILKDLLPYGKKIVLVNRQSSLKNIFGVYPDNQAYAKKILEYLSGLNHKKLLYIYELSKPNQIQILKYLKSECRTYGILPENIHVKATREMASSGQIYRDATREGLCEFSPTVIIAGFDWIAHNVYAELSEMGINIPDDMSVLSIGDYAIAARLHPPVTSLKIDTNKLGRCAARIVLENYEEDILIEPELIERASCAAIQT